MNISNIYENQQFFNYKKIINQIQDIILDYDVTEKLFILFSIILYPILGLLNIDIIVP